VIALVEQGGGRSEGLQVQAVLGLTLVPVALEAVLREENGLTIVSKPRVVAGVRTAVASFEGRFDAGATAGAVAARTTGSRAAAGADAAAGAGAALPRSCTPAGAGAERVTAPRSATE
jgi:hypothetical protein